MITDERQLVTQSPSSKSGSVPLLGHGGSNSPNRVSGSFAGRDERCWLAAEWGLLNAQFLQLVAQSPEGNALKPGGMYIDLAFPLDGRKGGPPFAVTIKDILDLFQARDFKLISREKSAQSIPRRRDAEELLLFQKMPREANHNLP